MHKMCYLDKNATPIIRPVKIDKTGSPRHPQWCVLKFRFRHNTKSTFFCFCFFFSEFLGIAANRENSPTTPSGASQGISHLQVRAAGYAATRQADQLLQASLVTALNVKSSGWGLCRQPCQATQVVEFFPPSLMLFFVCFKVCFQ